MAKKQGEDWITQTEAAKLKGMSLAAVNMLVSRGRWQSKEMYGKRLVLRSEVEAFEPRPKKRAVKKGSKKR